jgi:hypothetical protein
MSAITVKDGTTIYYKPFVWTKTADTILSSIGRFASRTLAEHGANNM